MRPLLLLAALLAICALLWLAFADPGVEAETPQPTAAPAPVEAAQALPPRPEPAAETRLSGTRRPVLSPAPDYPEADRELDLHGEVVFEDGAPVAGALVEVQAVPGRDFHGLDILENRRRESVATIRTDRLGRFVVRVERDRPHDLTADIPGWIAPCARTRYAGEFVRIVASPAATLRGRITRATDGSGVSDVPVRWFLIGTSGSGDETRTGPDGRYSFDTLPAARITLEVKPPVLRPPPWTEVVLLQGTETVQDFSVEAGQSVYGRIVDSRTGEGIPGAEITDGWVYRRVFHSDEQGYYRLTGLYSGSEYPFDLHARATGYGGWNTKVDPFEGEELEFNIELDPERRLTGRVVDGTGAPVAGAYVAAVSSTYPRVQKIDWISGKTAEDGSFELGRLRPDIPHAVLIRKPGFGTRFYELPPEERSLAIIELPELLLLPAATIRGILVDATQAGIPGAKILVKGQNSDRDRFNPREIQGLDSYCKMRSTRTDDLGRFAMTDLAEGEYAISVDLPNQPEKELGSVDLLDGELRDDLLYEFRIGLSLSGVVRNEDGEPVSTIFLSLVPMAGGQSRTALTHVDGSFEFRGLPDAEFRLVCCRSLASGYPETHHFAVTTQEGIRPGGPPLEIVLPAAKPIQGRLLAADGSPAAGHRMWVEIAPGEKLPTWTEGDGSFEFRVAPARLFDIYSNPPRAKHGLPGSGPVLLATEVLSGTTGLTLVLPEAE